MPFRRRRRSSRSTESPSRAAVSPPRQPRLRRAAAATIEQLENRQLLTALVNGLFQGTGTQFDGRPVFEYAQAGGTTVRISVVGNISAEFIGGREGFGPVQVTDLLPAGTQDSDVYLFSIYVSKSDMNSAISIAQVPDPSAEERPMDPFGGSVSVRINHASIDGQSEVLSLTNGGVYIGAETPADAQDPANNIPRLTSTTRRFGQRPSSAGEMYAGLEVAPGNDLGKFFLGGTITGIVDVPGSMDTFYAGNILTGEAAGISYGQTSSINRNFNIGKDIRNLISADSFGTLSLTDPMNDGELEDIRYKTGFQLYVGGKIGQIKAGDSFLGQARVANDSRVRGPGISQTEVEFRGIDLPPGDASYFDPQFFGYDISLGGKSPNAAFFNDTFDTAQWLGTAWNQRLNSDQVIVLNGSLENNGDTASDVLDFYAVPLIAGQRFSVQLSDDFVGQNTSSHPRLGIFDPDGRLIASDYSNVNRYSRINSTLTITADRPGSYRIAVANFGDYNFNGANDGFESVSRSIPNPYTLTIKRVSDIALGGLVATNHIATFDTDRGIEVDRGDLGAVFAGFGSVADAADPVSDAFDSARAGTIYSISAPWYVPAGNIRVLDAGAIGVVHDDGLVPSFGINGVTVMTGVDFLVRKGSVGLIRTTLSTGSPAEMGINDDIGGIYPAATDDLSTVPSTSAVGDEIQLVDAAGSFDGDLLSNGAIGTIRANLIGSIRVGNETALGNGSGAPVFMANVDARGNDGVIDLIDVGTVMFGPAITTGPGGNMRYIHVAPGGVILRDPAFGGGSPEETIYDPGQRVTITDDSGTPITLTPTPRDRDPLAGIGDPQFVNPGQLSVLTYPIRSGGSAIVRVSVTQTATVATQPSGGGLSIDTGSSSSGGAEIGTIDFVNNPTNAGVPITFDPINRLYTVGTSTALRPIDVTATGSAPVDIWQIEAPAATTLRNVLNDTTNGEIVNIDGGTSDVSGPSIVLVQADSVGIAKSHTGAAVNGFITPDRLTLGTDVINTYPYVQQRNLIHVTDLNSAVSRGAIGNILASNINAVRANAGGGNNRAVFEGIVAPVVSSQSGTAASNTGNIVSVSIGEGISPSGTGLVGLSGLYADGAIDSVTGSGVGNDIRGDIIATGGSSTPTFAIGSIRLKGGSIVDADIEVVTVSVSGSNFAGGEEGNSNLSFLDGFDTADAPVFDIGSIRLDGVGGILGAFIGGADIGPIAINGGFGLINSSILSTGDNTIAGVTTDGYGIRSTIIEGGANINTITARGSGKRLSTESFSPTVRFSEKYSYDPYSGSQIDALNDLHTYLGTTAASPKRKGLSDAGVIEDSSFLGSRRLDSLSAYRIIGREVFQTSNGQRSRIPLGSTDYPMRINMANGVGKITVGDLVDGLSMTSAGITSMSVANDMLNSALNIGGELKSLSVGALRGTTSVKAVGPNGIIDSISTKHSLYGSINSTKGIGTISVGTDLGSPSVQTSGNLKKLIVNGSVLTGAFVRTAKTLSNLTIGKDVKADATIRAHAFGTQTIKGQVIGNIQVI